MATVLDTSLLALLAPVFSMIFVFLVVYVVLQGSRMMGDNKGIHALIALSVAFFVGITPQVARLIIFMAPWFVVMIVFIMFLFMIGLFAGFTQDNMLESFGGRSGGFWWIVFFSGLIIVFAFSNVFGQQLLEGSGGEAAPVNATQSQFAKNVGSTLFHPKVLGLLLILLIASFTVRLMAEGR